MQHSKITHIGQWVSESVKSVSQWVSESVSQWVSESVKQWVSESVRQWVSELVSELVSQLVSKSMSQWVSESVSQWVNESLYDSSIQIFRKQEIFFTWFFILVLAVLQIFLRNFDSCLYVCHRCVKVLQSMQCMCKKCAQTILDMPKCTGIWTFTLNSIAGDVWRCLRKAGGGGGGVGVRGRD